MGASEGRLDKPEEPSKEDHKPLDVALAAMLLEETSKLVHKAVEAAMLRETADNPPPIMSPEEGRRGSPRREGVRSEKRAEGERSEEREWWSEYEGI